MAKTASEILQFHFKPAILIESGERIITPSLRNTNESRIERLKEIMENIPILPSTPSSITISVIFNKFKKKLKNKNEIFYKRELRLLTYSLIYSEGQLTSIFSNEAELDLVLSMLEADWRDSFLIGLVDCYLRNWETKNTKSLQKISKFVLDKLENYKGNRKGLLSFKKHKRFFNPNNGDLVLGHEMAIKNIPINNICSYISVPDSWISYPYFSKVIVTYFEKSKEHIINNFDSIHQVLIKHNNKKTDKRIISKTIILGNLPQYSGLQDKVKKIAFKRIGDPSNVANWTAFDGATELESSEMKDARIILNEWITKEFINVFFNVCINDNRRRKFWLKYASKISSFKIYGPTRIKYQLKQNQNIAEYINGRFEVVESNKNISAFILYIENHMLIEFSNNGFAFIAYKMDSLHKPQLKHKLNSIEDLRNSLMGLAMKTSAGYSYYYDEGRLLHMDSNEIWEVKFDRWIRKKVLNEF